MNAFDKAQPKDEANNSQRSAAVPSHRSSDVAFANLFTALEVEAAAVKGGDESSEESDQENAVVKKGKNLKGKKKGKKTSKVVRKKGGQDEDLDVLDALLVQNGQSEEDEEDDL